MATRVVGIKFNSEDAKRAAEKAAEQFKRRIDAAQARVAGFASIRANDEAVEKAVHLESESEDLDQSEHKVE